MGYSSIAALGFPTPILQVERGFATPFETRIDPILSVRRSREFRVSADSEFPPSRKYLADVRYLYLSAG